MISKGLAYSKGRDRSPDPGDKENEKEITR